MLQDPKVVGLWQIAECVCGVFPCLFKANSEDIHTLSWI